MERARRFARWCRNVGFFAFGWSIADLAHGDRIGFVGLLFAVTILTASVVAFPRSEDGGAR